MRGIKIDIVRLSGWRKIFKRYPLVTFAAVLALGMVGLSLVFAANAGPDDASSFDPSSVLPQPVSIPAAVSTVFNAETIKQYDGQDGRKCYAAVSGKVYEIPQSGQWQSGRHLPSNGQAYCGADLTQAIGASPHGTSKLAELPVVGSFR